MSVNKIILLGNLCHDPSIKTIDNWGKVVNFSLATNERSYDLSNGQRIPERTEYHNIFISGKIAEVAEKYLKKGDKVYLEGESRTQSYEDKNGGAKRYFHQVYVKKLELLTPKREKNENSFFLEK